jgi:sugar phosphate isomerase/epimerase
MDLGLVFWAEGDPETHLKELKGFGLRACQLGVPPDMDCRASAEGWRRAFASEGDFVSNAVCSYAGEDYANLERVHNTVGFTAPGYAAERIARTKEVSAFAAELGLTSLSCHIGFIPDDRTSSMHAELLAIARELCDACAAYRQHFVLETGQESAATLLQFLGDVERPNLKVNFDPANMILYGSGDPLQALHMLAQHVLSVHCKDGRSPKAAGELGQEVALGNGEVDFPGFLQLLKTMNYQGLLTIEREEPNAAQRKADIELGVKRLVEWKRVLA